jgi:hypothetical protein
MEERLEFVGTVVRDKSVVKIFRQFDPANGFQYFLEKNGKLQPLDAFGEKEYGFRMPYPVILDHWVEVGYVNLKEYHIERDDFDAEIGGQKLRIWCEEAIHYYESGEDLGFWKEYWGLVKKERGTLFYFFEKFFQEEKNCSKNDQWKPWEFSRKILNVSLGEYRDELIDNFIEKLSYVLMGDDLEKPRNKAKGLLVWLETHIARNWGANILSAMGKVLFGLYEWDYLTAPERKEMAAAIYDRLLELAKKEEEWAGLSLEEWLDLLRKKLVAEKGIKDTDAAFWKWVKHYIEKENIYNLFRWAFEGNVDWDWMPRSERRKLADTLEKFIIEKLEEQSESTV